jgi:hypothetical protein
VIRAEIISFLCTPEHNAPVLYIRKAIEQDRDPGDRKPEKPGCRSSEGVRWRPGLPIFRLYYRGESGYIAQMSNFAQRSLSHATSEGEWGIVGVPCDMKKTRPEALFTPSYASGRLLGQAS